MSTVEAVREATPVVALDKEIDTHRETLRQRVLTHGKERLSALGSSRLLKTVGTLAILAGAAAIATGIAFYSSAIIPAVGITGLLAGGSASAAWGIITGVWGALKGHKNKFDKA